MTAPQLIIYRRHELPSCPFRVLLVLWIWMSRRSNIHASTSLSSEQRRVRGEQQCGSFDKLRHCRESWPHCASNTTREPVGFTGRVVFGVCLYQPFCLVCVHLRSGLSHPFHLFSVFIE